MSESATELPPTCLNCHAPLTGNFCATCGQQVKEIRRPFFYLLADALRALFEVDGRAYRTLYLLFTRPGYLTREYVSGKRASYTPPLRLFLVISIGFFLMVSAFNAVQSIGMATAEPAPVVTVDDTGEDAFSDDDMSELLDIAERFSVPFFSETRNANLRMYMRSQAESNIELLREDPGEFFYGSLEYITLFILLMLPILALVQKLLYLRSRRYYVEHLLLTLHNHTFLIFAIFLATAMGLVADAEIPVLSWIADYVGSAIFLWIIAYLFLSLRNFFGQGYMITTLKFLTMVIIYSIVTAAGIFYFMVTLFFLT